MDRLSLSNTLTYFLRFACASSAGILMLYAVEWMPRVTHGFAMYYTYSRTVLQGDPLAPLYDVDVFNMKMRSYGITNVVDMPNNPPTTALATLPVAWLSPENAKRVWTILLLLAFGASMALLFRTFGLSLRTNFGLGLFALTLVWRPLYENIAFGQMYVILLFGFSVSIWGLKRDVSFLTATPVSTTLLLKGYGPLILLWFAATKRWRELISAAAIVLVVVAITIPLLGASSWKVYFSEVVSSLGLLPVHAHVAYQTVNGLLFHLFTYDSRWLPFPILDLPTNAVRIISYTLNAAIVLATLARARMASAPLTFAAMVAASVVTAPLAEEHHYVVFLPLVIGLSEMLHRRYSITRRFGATETLFIISVLIIAIPLPFESLQFAAAPLVLLGYPKLYAGLALLFCFHRLTRPSSLVA